MISKNNSADYYISELKKGNYFSFTRWGDGEWLCTSGENRPKEAAGHNCDFHLYFPDMAKDLQKALRSDKDYHKAIWPTTHGQIRKNLPLIMSCLDGVEVEWSNAIVWEDLVIREGVDKMVNQLKEMNFVMVSESSKKQLDFLTDFIEVPSKNCYLEKERIKDDMKTMVKKYPNVVFGMSASMATNAIVDELFDEIGDKCWMIDFGSIWDPFVGKHTRSYHREYLKKTI